MRDAVLHLLLLSLWGGAAAVGALAVSAALRGAAKAAGLTWLLVDNTLVQFLTVTAASFAAAALIGYVTGYVLKRKGR